MNFYKIENNKKNFRFWIPLGFSNHRHSTRRAQHETLASDVCRTSNSEGKKYFFLVFSKINLIFLLQSVRISAQDEKEPSGVGVFLLQTSLADSKELFKAIDSRILQVRPFLSIKIVKDQIVFLLRPKSVRCYNKKLLYNNDYFR